MRFVLTLCFALCIVGQLRAQSGQFDNIVLDGGGFLPFIAMQNTNGTHVITGFQDRFGVAVNGAYKFYINDNSKDDALVLTRLGTTVKAGLTVAYNAFPGSGFLPVVTIEDEFTGNQFITSISNFASNRMLNFGNFSGRLNAFVLNENAKWEALVVGGEGIGVGTLDAKAPIHVYSEDSSSPVLIQEARILVENADPTTTVRDMFELVNNGGSRFTFTDTSIGSRWEFSSNGGGSFSISQAGTGGSEMRITPSGRVILGPGGAANMDLRPNGDMIIAGTLIQSSDRNRKKNLRHVDSSDVLNKLAKMPVYTWQFDDEESGVTHMGPTAQDFRTSFDLGYDDKTIAPVDTAGVSLAAIKALHADVRAKEDRIVELESQLASMRTKLAKAELKLAASDRKQKQTQEEIAQILKRLDQLEPSDN